MGDWTLQLRTSWLPLQTADYTIARGITVPLLSPPAFEDPIVPRRLPLSLTRSTRDG
jgi:hypothetical protein